MTLKVNYPRGSCAICGSTWGNYWRPVEGEDLFFCCELCYVQFQNMVDEVKRRKSWDRVEELEIQGDYRGRNVSAHRAGESFRFFIMFGSAGQIREFREL